MILSTVFTSMYLCFRLTGYFFSLTFIEHWSAYHVHAPLRLGEVHGVMTGALERLQIGLKFAALLCVLMYALPELVSDNLKPEHFQAALLALRVVSIE